MPLHLLQGVVSLLLFSALCNGIREDCFEEDLSVECIDLDLIEIQTLDIPNNVQSLDLSSNKLTELKRVDWQRYNFLESLYLSDNEIFITEKDAFVDLKNLKNLDLSKNKLRYISPEIFKNNQLLENVNFRGNSELYLPPNSHFLMSQSLVSLDLSYCGLTSVNPLTFSQLPNLIHLILRYNGLTTVSSNTFNYLENLNTLDLSQNKLNCDCEIVEILNLVSSRTQVERRKQQSPVKCLDDGIYRTLWSANRVNKPCLMETMTTIKVDGTSHINEISTLPTTNDKTKEINSETTEISTADNSFAISQGPTLMKTAETMFDDEASYVTEINLQMTSEDRNSESTKKLTTHTSYHSRNFKIEEIEVTDTPPVSLWDNFLSRKFDIILVFLVLPVTLAISVFASIVAVNRCIHWLELRSKPNEEINCRISQTSLIPSFYNEMKRSSVSRSLYSDATKPHEPIYEEID